MNNIIEFLPDMKTGDELIHELSILPEYNEDIRFKDVATRLMALSDLHSIYIPSKMTIEIYSKLYLSLLHSLQKKISKTAILQRNENYKAIKSGSCAGIIGGSDSFTIIGKSGIGKSSAISRSIDLIMQNRIIETKDPYTKLIPYLVVQCPFDSSVKGLLLEIIRKVDEEIGSEYYKNALKIRVTTDMLIGSVSQVAINHIGVLVVDEIQNVVNSKNGKNLVGMLTQLINNSGISICMVGTPESNEFFEQTIQLARRSLGLQYSSLAYDDYFYNFCKILFSYQYTKQETTITDAIINWFYEHSGGVISTVVSLIHDAQEIAILNGQEKLNLETLNEAYNKRLTMLHGFIDIPIKHSSIKKVKNHTDTDAKNTITIEHTISEVVLNAKATNTDIIEPLKQIIEVEEVRI